MTTPDPVRAYLAGLPEPMLPPGLWPRLQSVRRRQRRRRLVARLSLAAAVVVALVAAPWLYLRLAEPGIPAAVVQQEHPAAVPDRVVLAELRAIDRALQEAYVAGANDSEVQVLWHAREQVLARMGATPAPEPIRI